MTPDIKYSSEMSSVKMQTLSELRMQIFGPGSECAPWRERETRASGPDPRVGGWILQVGLGPLVCETKRGSASTNLSTFDRTDTYALR